MAGSKAPDAFRTIGELSEELGVPQHVLRYWESKFPLKPLQRAGNRRYYRPADVELARRIHQLLAEEGYTVRGVQKLLRDGQVDVTDGPGLLLDGEGSSVSADDLRRLREQLVSALEE
uniref:MerR family transcriptional regulator n=1 Tax=uncultured Sphingomonas sp. TaxID=158754 RepID=UPI0025CF2E19|nr:MerR family transcriptional regulator [uncultured Sphingomonas sp.]